MNPVSILMLGLAMSTDAFAAALGKGAGLTKPRWTEALRIGLIFGVVEAMTPVIGWLLGSAASRLIEEWDHWIAFGVLSALGLHMIYKAVAGEEDLPDEQSDREGHWMAVALAGLATSIDAMAVGVSLAFVDANIAIIAAVIGTCTFVMVTLGIMAGGVLGSVFGKRAELLGGVVLILVGSSILYEHMGGAVA